MQALQLVTGIPHITAHGGVRPGTLGIAEETQVQLDQAGHGRGRVIVETEGAQALLRQLGADQVVMVEADHAARLELAGGGLADVVQQRSQTHDQVGTVETATCLLVADGLVQHRQSVLVDVFVVVVLVNLEPQGGNLRQHPVAEPRIHQQLDPDVRVVRAQQLGQLVADAFGRDITDAVRHRFHRGEGVGLEGESELCGEPGRPHHAKRIVAE